MQWYIGITTAPRKEPTIQQTVDSIRLAGWEPIVYSEPESQLTNCLTIHNPTRLGVWHNWLKVCRDALASNADMIMTVQDDSIFHPESREFVEQILPTIKYNLGYLSLYTPKHYQHWKDGRQRPFGVYEVKTKSVWGAMAFVFEPKTLRQLIQHPRAQNWLGAVVKNKKRWKEIKENRRQNPHLIQNSDTAIGIILSKHMKKRLMYMSPSLVDHCAKYSSIAHGGNSGKRNAYYIADHSLPLSIQIPT